jgi:hypothetical protein
MYGCTQRLESLGLGIGVPYLAREMAQLLQSYGPVAALAMGDAG